LAILSEIFIQIDYFSKRYARKQIWVLFSNTLYKLNLSVFESSLHYPLYRPYRIVSWDMHVAINC